MIELDGSMGEGGGQILRSALALSAITGKAFRLRKIRANRAKPGLQPQHLMCVLAVARICGAELAGASLQSTELTFEPGTIQAGTYDFRIRTAGATGLLLHAIYLPLALQREPSEVTLVGGTHVSASPCFHFLQQTWARYLACLGIDISMVMDRPGFYPRGGGVVRATIQPTREVRPFQGLTNHQLSKVSITSAVAGLPQEIADRQLHRAMTGLAKHRRILNGEIENWSDGPGTYLGISLDTEPVPTLFFGLGARGKRAETVADEAVEQTLAYLETHPLAVDVHSADQLVLPLAFSQGSSRFRITEVSSHLTTNIEVISRFLDRRIFVDGAEGAPGEVRVE